MPLIEGIFDHLQGSGLYCLLDFFEGYGQFLLDESCQELFSFLIDMDVYTPTRLLMGGKDSVVCW